MNKKITLLVLLGCVVCVAALALTVDVADGSFKLKKRHEFGQTHDPDSGYSSSNQSCRAKCSAAKGKSCGKNWQNCCQPDKCDENWYGDYCNKRLAIPGCTPP